MIYVVSSKKTSRLYDTIIICIFRFFAITSNDKIDRNALPEPFAMDSELTTEFVAPRNPLEEAAAGIWKEVLLITHVGIENDFFEMGGHSLLATQLTSRLRKIFNIQIKLHDILRAPTIAGFLKIAESDPEKFMNLNKPAKLFLKRKQLYSRAIIKRLFCRG